MAKPRIHRAFPVKKDFSFFVRCHSLSIVKNHLTNYIAKPIANTNEPVTKKLFKLAGKKRELY